MCFEVTRFLLLVFHKCLETNKCVKLKMDSVFGKTPLHSQYCRNLHVSCYSHSILNIFKIDSPYYNYSLEAEDNLVKLEYDSK